MTTTTLAANRRLALLLGWSDITDVGNALLGMPPWGIPNARGQAQVPNWAGSWKEAGPLVSKYRLQITAMSTCVAVSGVVVRYADHANDDAATLFGIAEALSMLLERSK